MDLCTFLSGQTDKKRNMKMVTISRKAERNPERFIDVDSVPTGGIICMGMAPFKDAPAMITVCQTDDCITGYIFPLREGFQIHYCNEYLRALNTGIDIHFNTYKQYGCLINDCYQAITQ